MIKIISSIQIDRLVKIMRFHKFAVLKRVFHIVFALYFILLAITPCSESKDYNNKSKSEFAHASHGHEDEGDVDDDCTPLCTCSCCTILFVVTHESTCESLVAEINTVYTVHQSSPKSGAIIPIWQPPKLA